MCKFATLILLILGACSHSNNYEQEFAKINKELAFTRNKLEAAVQKIDSLSKRLFILSDKVEQHKVEISRSVPKKLKVVRLVPKAKQLLTDQYEQRPATEEEPPKSAKQLYEHALSTYRSGRFDDAEVAFLTFLNFYPQHEYSDNAYYWIGESRMDRKDIEASVDAFVTVVDKFPDGNKVPDALLKLGYAYQMLGKREEALLTLKELAVTYPRSIAAKKARLRLMQIDPTEG